MIVVRLIDDAGSATNVVHLTIPEGLWPVIEKILPAPASKPRGDGRVSRIVPP